MWNRYMRDMPELHLSVQISITLISVKPNFITFIVKVLKAITL